jgi:hypothetical protein
MRFDKKEIKKNYFILSYKIVFLQNIIMPHNRFCKRIFFGHNKHDIHKKNHFGFVYHLRTSKLQWLCCPSTIQFPPISLKHRYSCMKFFERTGNRNRAAPQTRKDKTAR